jgi:hypothetical protein
MDRGPITEALLEALTAGTAKQGGIGIAPADRVYPYFMLYPVPGGAFIPSFSKQWRLVELVYQVTSVGQNYLQCEGMADRVRGVVLETNASYPIVVIGPQKVTSRAPDVMATPPEPDVSGNVWTTAERFLLSIDVGGS